MSETKNINVLFQTKEIKSCNSNRIKNYDFSQKAFKLRKISGNEQAQKELLKKNQKLELQFKHQCFYTGEPLQDDYFILYALDRKIISRKMRQRIQICNNCEDPLPLSKYQEDLQYCIYCQNQNKCICCKTPLSPLNNERITLTKGVFCETCISHELKCELCKAPTSISKSASFQKELLICDYCYTNYIGITGNLDKIITEIQQLFFKFDPDYSFILKGSRMITKPYFKTPNHSLKSSIRIKNNTLDIHEDIPEPYLYEYLVATYAQKGIEEWKNIHNQKAKTALFYWIRFIALDQLKLFKQTLQVKRIATSKQQDKSIKEYFLQFYHLYKNNHESTKLYRQIKYKLEKKII